MLKQVKSVPLLLLGLAFSVAAGCSESQKMDSRALEVYRTSFMLDDEPDGVQTVADVRATLLGDLNSPLDHDHDGDGHPDHAPEDHPVDSHDEHAHGEDHDGHDHHDDDHAHDDHAEHDGDGDGHHEEDGDGHDGDELADHDDHASHDHASHDHAADDHDDHAEHGASDRPEEHADHAHGHEHAHDTKSRHVAMVGHIGGLANPWSGVHPEYPFAKAEAVFFLSDPQAVIENEEAGHKHAPGEECAFCAAHAADNADMIALVQFVGEDGKVLKTDVRDLFQVRENDTVVVHGEARVTEGGILVVDARGLYVRN
ncbi:MAG: hypothetical protein AAGD11_15935 [Planctomycetota bacterium]